MRSTMVPVLIIAVLAGAGWFYRDPLQQQLGKLRASFEPTPVVGSQPDQGRLEPRKETVYRWVDENGITHFDQQASAGSEAVVVDQSKIQSLDKYSPAAPVTSSSAPTGSEQAEAKRRGMSAVERIPQAQAAPL